jgi:hypothetical protein
VTNNLEKASLAQMSQVKQEPAVREDGQKRRWSLLPLSPLNSVLEAFEFGANKYGTDNWQKGMSWSRPYNAAMRHITEWWSGEKNAKDSNVHHLAHAIANLMFLLEYEETRVGTDDREMGYAPPSINEQAINIVKDRLKEGMETFQQDFTLEERLKSAGIRPKPLSLTGVEYQIPNRVRVHNDGSYGH